MTPLQRALDPPAQTRGHHSTGSALSFDLVFVIAVPRLSGAHAHRFD